MASAETSPRGEALANRGADSVCCWAIIPHLFTVFSTGKIIDDARMNHSPIGLCLIYKKVRDE